MAEREEVTLIQQKASDSIKQLLTEVKNLHAKKEITFNESSEIQQAEKMLKKARKSFEKKQYGTAIRQAHAALISIPGHPEAQRIAKIALEKNIALQTKK